MLFNMPPEAGRGCGGSDSVHHRGTPAAGGLLTELTTAPRANILSYLSFLCIWLGCHIGG